MTDTPGWYLEWVARHVAAYSLPDAAVETFAAWAPAWAVNFTADELNHATDALLTDRRVDDKQRLLTNFANNHRLLIPEAVAARRGKTRQAAALAAYDRPDGTCMFCGDSGFAVVPHPGKDPNANHFPAPLNDVLTAAPHWTTPDGSPGWHTLAVLCDCRLGRHILGKQEDTVGAGRARNRCMTLAEYERAYPNYREVAAEIAARRAATRSPFDAQAAAAKIRAMIDKSRRDRESGRRTVRGPEAL